MVSNIRCKLRLLANGDSWTSAWPFEEKTGNRDIGWPAIISDHFGFDLIDKSRAGSSNYRIYRKTFDAIIDDCVDVVIICLTQYKRFETGINFGDYAGKIYQHMPGYKISDEAFEKFFNGYKQYADMLRMVISLQLVCQHKNIGCYFLDTFRNNLKRNISLEEFKDILRSPESVFHNMDDKRIEEKFNNIKKLESKINYANFISNDSWQTLLGKDLIEYSHPTIDGHRKIANIMIDYLKEKGY